MSCYTADETFFNCVGCKTREEHDAICCYGPKGIAVPPAGFATITGFDKLVNYDHADFHVKITDEARKLGQLLSEKNKAYGNSFASVPAIMNILYPNGISGGAVEDALLIVRVLDKLQRIANNNDPFGEDPWQDVAGYALLRVATRTKK
jgi:hypothetical protein